MRWALLVICVAWATVVHAQGETCDALERFAKQEDAAAMGLGPAICSKSIVLGAGASYDCYWSYDFRSTDALQAFADTRALLLACAEPIGIADAPAVNHPDSYDQQMAIMGDYVLSLSLKDKGGLNQTLVFLRAAQR